MKKASHRTTDRDEPDIPTEVELEILDRVLPGHRSAMRAVALEAWKAAMRDGLALPAALPRIRECVRQALDQLASELPLLAREADRIARDQRLPWDRALEEAKARHPGVVEALGLDVGYRKEIVVLPRNAKVVSATWDGAVLNEWLATAATYEADPREVLKDKALKLSEEKKVGFLEALEEVKRSEPALVSLVADFNAAL